MVDKDRTIALDMKANKRDKEKVCSLMEMGEIAVIGASLPSRRALPCSRKAGIDRAHAPNPEQRKG